MPIVGHEESNEYWARYDHKNFAAHCSGNMRMPQIGELVELGNLVKNTNEFTGTYGWPTINYYYRSDTRYGGVVKRSYNLAMKKEGKNGPNDKIYASCIIN
ncbi:adhesion domain-containing protein [Xenorhabdus hominickii]|nr:DUF823 domain-containing adhesin [Xenorhabdus hominickii]